MQLVVVSEWWDYIPGFLPPESFAQLYSEVAPMCKQYSVRVRDQQFDSRRVSCYFTDTSKSSSVRYNYDNLSAYDWSKSPILVDIKLKVEKFLETHYDYCLVHIYRDGNDMINYHNDKEALSSDIASLSLGTARKFRFRKIEEKSGWEAEYVLQNGDMIHMKIGCQQRYKHSVPVEVRVREPRINLTFRKFE